MTPKLKRHLAAVMIFLAAGVIVGEVYFRCLVQIGGGANVPLARELRTIPMRLSEWQGVEDPIAADVLLRIGAMDTLRRSYVSSAVGRDVRIDLYIAYFGGIRGTAPHHPDVCMPGAGWDILDREMETVRLPGFGDEPLEVHRDVFEHRATQQKRIVIWWEYIHGQNVASRAWQRLKWVLPGFLGGKRGSILQVQVASDFVGDSKDRMDVITGFMDRLGPHLTPVLPRATNSGVAAK